ncbi:hypothetical protein P3G55_14000 [Leptospira sp. 96542]|nr:hypothetical protein [Leptospira sp. 96542]
MSSFLKRSLYAALLAFLVFILFVQSQTFKKYFKYLSHLQKEQSDAKIPFRYANTIIAELESLFNQNIKNCDKNLSIFPEIVQNERGEISQIIKFSTIPCDYHLLSENKIPQTPKHGHYILLKTNDNRSNLSDEIRKIAESNHYLLLEITK